ncbi:hypothetical protein J6590_001682 [Homalodisca vitripennis]|nr:hypothetical protein J6590_001682 [Homalodisca vitripennis]
MKGFKNDVYAAFSLLGTPLSAPNFDYYPSPFLRIMYCSNVSGGSICFHGTLGPALQLLKYGVLQLFILSVDEALGASACSNVRSTRLCDISEHLLSTVFISRVHVLYVITERRFGSDVRQSRTSRFVTALWGLYLTAHKECMSPIYEELVMAKARGEQSRLEIIRKCLCDITTPCDLNYIMNQLIFHFFGLAWAGNDCLQSGDEMCNEKEKDPLRGQDLHFKQILDIRVINDELNCVPASYPYRGVVAASEKSFPL